MGLDALVVPPPLCWVRGTGGVVGGLGLVVGVKVLAFVVGTWWWKGPLWRGGWPGSIMRVHVRLVGW